MVYVPLEKGKEIAVTELLALVMVTLDEGTTLQE